MMVTREIPAFAGMKSMRGMKRGKEMKGDYFTVTLFAKFLGISGLCPRSTPK
jgi:hypothetical protein